MSWFLQPVQVIAWLSPFGGGQNELILAQDALHLGPQFDVDAVRIKVMGLLKKKLNRYSGSF